MYLHFEAAFGVAFALWALYLERHKITRRIVDLLGRDPRA
jgi:hypothetical protein